MGRGRGHGSTGRLRESTPLWDLRSRAQRQVPGRQNCKAAASQLPRCADEATEVQGSVIWLCTSRSCLWPSEDRSLVGGTVGVRVWGACLASTAPNPACQEAWPTMLV